MKHSTNIMITAVFTFAGAILLFTGCAELQKKLPDPIAPGVAIHPEGWVAAHGNAIRQSGGDMQECLTCHGKKFNGGTTRVSCLSCHHPSGVTHISLVRSRSWKLEGCRTCHGQSYDGGASNLSCLTCHTKQDGPENCTTCHGDVNPAPPRDLSGNTSTTARGVGAHQAHLAATFGKPVTCADCHTVPASLNAPGHVDSPDGKAEVLLAGALARTKSNVPGTQSYTSTMPTFEPNPAYDYSSGTCSNVYCHGYFKNGNTDNVVSWTSQVQCGSCHGDISKATLAERALPKTTTEGGNHLNVLTCNTCHADVVDAQLKIINPAKHMNGKLNVFGSERDY